MSSLIGEAADQDEVFWNNPIWADEEEDESFSENDEEAQVKPDEFDSDFNDTEDEGSEEENSEDDRPRRRAAKKVLWFTYHHYDCQLFVNIG
jgi:hypothetical protein